MITHSQILDNFTLAFPPPNPGDNANVFSVSCHKDETLGFPEEEAYVFIGDIHLLTKNDAKKYPKKQFVQPKDFTTFLASLKELKERWTDNFKVYQVGDLFDVWRALGEGSEEKKVDDIFLDFEDMGDMLKSDPPFGADTTIIAGNHDYALHKLPDWYAPRLHTIKDIEGKDRILVIHGDILDPIEKFPDWIKALAVRIAKGAKSDGYIIDEADKDEKEVVEFNKKIVSGEGKIGLGSQELIEDDSSRDHFKSAPYNVIDGDKLPEDDRRLRFYKSAKELALKLRTEHALDIRTIVIGHSHYARVIKGDRGDGELFSLVDCGAWYGKCRLGRTQGYPWIHCGQIVILTENEFRIYQLGHNRTTAP